MGWRVAAGGRQLIQGDHVTSELAPMPAPVEGGDAGDNQHQLTEVAAGTADDGGDGTIEGSSTEVSTPDVHSDHHIFSSCHFYQTIVMHLKD